MIDSLDDQSSDPNFQHNHKPSDSRNPDTDPFPSSSISDSDPIHKELRSLIEKHRNLYLSKDHSDLVSILSKDQHSL